MLAYRVAPHDPKARRRAPGHSLYVHPAQGGGRWDNPDSYLVLYLAASPECAVAEVFQGLSVWRAEMLLHPASGLERALLTVELPAPTRWCDLDDAQTLVEFATRPSRVVTKNTASTQFLAQRIFDSGRYAGIRWWSSVDADMVVYALWDMTDVRAVRSEALTVDHPALTAAAHRLAKPVRR